MGRMAKKSKKLKQTLLFSDDVLKRAAGTKPPKPRAKANIPPQDIHCERCLVLGDMLFIKDPVTGEKTTYYGYEEAMIPGKLAYELHLRGIVHVMNQYLLSWINDDIKKQKNISTRG